jgi:hypothetical protein
MVPPSWSPASIHRAALASQQASDNGAGRWSRLAAATYQRVAAAALQKERSDRSGIVATEDGITRAGWETGGGWPDRLCQELDAVIARLDPVPAEVVRAAHAAFGLRTVDAELAAIVNDWLLDRPLAGVRGAEGPRSLTFEAPGLTVEVEVTVVGPRRRLIGQLVPACLATVTVRHSGGVLQVDADELGRFRADDLPPGPASLRCDLAGDRDGGPVVTAWVTI